MIYVGIGGIGGAIVRFLLGKWIAGKTTSSFPIGTWIINITGSFFLGILFVLHLRHMFSDWAWLLLGTGFLGAYTTFSTFGYETIQLLEKKEVGNALLYVMTSVVLAILFAWGGGQIGKMIAV
ncbi:fluoride efflux transporter CrcB [Bacillus sp. FJAT-50079]|uniref:fluoride efflux transporter CrcB n=1 Tax=Bacillus sp. FJAT-50079 TaxID=2833577 RepID=UPI001BC99E5A|nr:fluoride efflux transporter CrcB [Bacillus sp. FJAT-50079]MBS4209454.1 fluoride efflux transporter CrcB [Bacillus sp. FJAT-50079]